MIPLNVEQHLGRRTWLLLLSKKITTSVVLLLSALILGSMKDFIGQAFSQGSQNHLISSIASFVALVLLFVAIIMFLVGYIIALISYRNYTFTLEEFGLKLRKGIFNIEEITVPYRQIQGVDVVQPIVYRLFGVSRLVLTTAGVEDKKEGADSNTVFDPIDSYLAEGVRVMLQRKVGVQIVEGEKKADVDIASGIRKTSDTNNINNLKI